MAEIPVSVVIRQSAPWMGSELSMRYPVVGIPTPPSDIDMLSASALEVAARAALNTPINVRADIIRLRRDILGWRAQPVGGGLDMNALVGAVRIAIRPVERRLNNMNRVMTQSGARLRRIERAQNRMDRRLRAVEGSVNGLQVAVGGLQNNVIRLEALRHNNQLASRNGAIFQPVPMNGVFVPQNYPPGPPPVPLTRQSQINGLNRAQLDAWLLFYQHPPLPGQTVQSKRTDLFALMTGQPL